jgi:hypothetical protein
MTVCTHEVAFGDFVEDPALAMCPVYQGAQLSDLDLAGPMIPLHRRRMEDAAAVRARSVLLESSIPLDDLSPVATLLLEPAWTGSAVIRRVVIAAARLAPRLLD